MGRLVPNFGKGGSVGGGWRFCLFELVQYTAFGFWSFFAQRGRYSRQKISNLEKILGWTPPLPLSF